MINTFYDPAMTGRTWGLMEALDGASLELSERVNEAGITCLTLSLV